MQLLFKPYIMRNIITVFIILFVSVLSAQEINQFDAQHKRHGKWQKKYEGTNQIRYQGQFEHGKEVGVFKFYHKQPKGKHASCIKEFTKNSDVAKVKYYSTYGLLLEEGQMKGKKRIGKWIGYDRKTKLKITEENYVNGKLEGEVKSFYTDGKLLKTETYKAGKKSGAVTMYAPNGKVVSKSSFLNDRKDGSFIKYDKKGKKKLEGKYKMGKPQGIWKYYKNGKLIRTKDYTKSNNPAKQ